MAEAGGHVHVNEGRARVQQIPSDSYTASTPRASLDGDLLLESRIATDVSSLYHRGEGTQSLFTSVTSASRHQAEGRWRSDVTPGNGFQNKTVFGTVPLLFLLVFLLFLLRSTSKQTFPTSVDCVGLCRCCVFVCGDAAVKLLLRSDRAAAAGGAEAASSSTPPPPLLHPSSIPPPFIPPPCCARGFILVDPSAATNVDLKDTSSYFTTVLRGASFQDRTLLSQLGARGGAKPLDSSKQLDTRERTGAKETLLTLRLKTHLINTDVTLDTNKPEAVSKYQSVHRHRSQPTSEVAAQRGPTPHTSSCCKQVQGHFHLNASRSKMQSHRSTETSPLELCTNQNHHTDTEVGAENQNRGRRQDRTEFK
ncbi:unnamed protein product [Pleuronectes platessa]|uniref:Uncharacterized protein n=1 Tax=Pleuronectes platessa TaxID=8262 RepID=A0A9N7TW63_PLEPL|nr:unnamed protein product [Pleuronectes platessa]